MATATATPQALLKLIESAIKGATYNSAGDEFYAYKRLGKNQRALAEKYLRNWHPVTIEGKTWEIKASFQWNEQLPVYIYGQSHSVG